MVAPLPDSRLYLLLAHSLLHFSIILAMVCSCMLLVPS